MNLAQRVVIVHKGALGDFLQAWPSILALSRHFGPERIYWAGREAYSLWTAPLGLKPALPGMRHHLDRLYGASSWPAELGGDLVIWFGLRTGPTEERFANLWFVPGLHAGRAAPVREAYRKELRRLGVLPAEDWPEIWRITCMPSAPPPARPTGRKPVLLFPGAGHAKRCWPLERFLSLARWLQAAGERPLFVLGPAEHERGVDVQNFERAAPEGLAELQACIETSRLVVGNDSGPLHLAGFCGTPCLALFGPASPNQWGPYGARTIWLGLDCSPCTDIGKMGCESADCLRGIGLKRVQREVERLLGE
jgi:ADP-heptose:LPS heptosyltransferase